jgi:hypothetical protein
MIRKSASTNRLAISRTRASGMGPSKPQPNADCTDTWTAAPAARAARAVAMMRFVASAVLMPVFLRL